MDESLGQLRVIVLVFFFFIEGRMKMNGSQKRGPASQSMGGTFL